MQAQPDRLIRHLMADQARYANETLAAYMNFVSDLGAVGRGAYSSGSFTPFGLKKMPEVDLPPEPASAAAHVPAASPEPEKQAKPVEKKAAPPAEPEKKTTVKPAKKAATATAASEKKAAGAASKKKSGGNKRSGSSSKPASAKK